VVKRRPLPFLPFLSLVLAIVEKAQILSGQAMGGLVVPIFEI
jgi:hypothetical protein